MRKKLGLVLLFMTTSVILYAASGTREIVGILTQETPVLKSFKIDQAVIIDTRHDQLTKGFEVTVDIPAELYPYIDGFVLNVFTLDAIPQAGSVSINVKDKLIDKLIPRSRKLCVYIPFLSRPYKEMITGTFVPNKIITDKEKAVVMIILPIMKGIPEFVYEQKFEMNLKSIPDEFGIIQIETTDMELKASFDTEAVLPLEKEYILSAGNHTIYLASGTKSVKTFPVFVDKGKIEIINTDVLLTEKTKVTFEGPDTVLIFVDGIRVSGLEAEVAIGEHTALFVLDPLKISRTFTVDDTTPIKLTFFLDILVEKSKDLQP